MNMHERLRKLEEVSESELQTLEIHIFFISNTRDAKKTTADIILSTENRGRAKLAYTFPGIVK